MGRRLGRWISLTKQSLAPATWRCCRTSSCQGFKKSMNSSKTALSLRRLQREFHAAARITCAGSRYDRVQPLLRSLNWLPIQGRIEHRLTTIMFICRNLAPPYLCSELRDVASVPGRRCLRSSSSRKSCVSDVQRWVAVPFLPQLSGFVVLCRHPSRH